MSNPWLSIELEDYEGHMGSENVRQLAALSDLFQRSLDLCTPESVAVVGVAGGNGLERVDSVITKRIVGLDINPRYLGAVRQGYGALPGLELCSTDLFDLPSSSAPVELVHAALVFEHTGLGRCLENALVLQALRDSFALIDISQFRQKLEEKRFHLSHQERRSLPAGKAIWLGIFAPGTE